ncbi:unnamed protein product, partial [Ascophyllum nodosum]
GSFAGLEGRGGGALLKGDLMTRPVSGKGPWRAAYYVIEKGRLLVFEDRHHVRPKQVHKISPRCCVFKTNQKPFSFEVVASGKILHLQGSSKEDILRWIAFLKAAINNSSPDESEPLLAEALKLEDTFYNASAVANGGGYLLDQETSCEEERHRRLQLEAAERDRFARRNWQQQQRQQGEDGDAFLSRREAAAVAAAAEAVSTAKERATKRAASKKV